MPSPNPIPQTGNGHDGSVLIVGCGYLGRRAAAAWLADGRRVVALTRGRTDELAALGIEPVVGDVLDPPSLQSLPPAATILYAVGLDRSAGRSMRDVYVQGLANLLTAARRPQRFVYISSTSVYGDHGGGWVDEDGPADGDEESGRVVREAESLLTDAIVLRFAGIYGSGRVIGKAGLLAGQPVTGDADRYLNLVHVEDGVQAIRLAEERGTPGRTYNVSDGHPVTRREYYTTAADLLGANSPTFVGDGGGPNRRIRSDRVRAELGFEPVYPTCRAGLTASMGPAVSR